MFPQINANCILTQLPYVSELDYGTISQDIETGMRYSFPLRGAGLPSMPSGPLGKFQLTFPMITDSEVYALKSFFETVRGRWGQFGLLDPGGNLLQSANGFNTSAWDLSTGSAGSPISIPDPFGGGLARVISPGGIDSFALSVVGPSTGGMNGYVMCASMWAKGTISNQQLFLGFADAYLTLKGQVWTLSSTAWKRIYFSCSLWNSGQFRMIIGGNGTFMFNSIDAFGAKVCSTKGPGQYVLTPGNYGWHPNCRFSSDVFERRVLGPNQNAVSLPVEEFFVA